MDFQSPKIILIGISGPSCSGKSSAANLLYKIVPKAKLLRQDAFYKPQNQLPRHPTFGEDWDHPDSFDTEEMLKDLQLLLQQGHQDDLEIPFDPSLNREKSSDLNLELLHAQRHLIIHDEIPQQVQFVIVEGILLYHDSRLADSFHLKVVLTAEEPVLRQRREARAGYATNDGTTWTDPPGYWEQLVYPNHQKYFKVPKDAVIYRTDPHLPESKVEDIVFNLCAELDDRFLGGCLKK